MKVLQVNKFFHSGAGAETSFHQTRELLASRGHEVIDFAMRHPDNRPSAQAAYFAPQRDYSGHGSPARRVADAASSIYSRQARASLGRLLDDERPDIAHLHNVYHQLTLSVVDELHARGVPMVMTLHDWKVACPSYTLFTEGAPCRRCPTSGVHNAVIHRCVKGSRAASAVAAAEAVVARTRGSYGRVQRYISPSRFGIEVGRLGGLDPDRIAYVPNFLDDEQLVREPRWDDDGPVLLYAGRLDVTKGIRQLLAAFGRMPGDAQLRVAGAGELLPEVEAAARADGRITVLGKLPKAELLEHYDRARAVVLPSIWEDNGPFVLLEAQARGKALVVTDRGGPKEFVEPGRSGFVVDPEDVDALAGALTSAIADREAAVALGRAGRARVLAEHSPEVHYGRLMSEYQTAMEALR